MVDSEEIIVKAERCLYSDDEWQWLLESDRVTRCRDCKHYRSVSEGYLKFCTKHSHMSEPEDYCSWGESEDY